MSTLSSCSRKWNVLGVGISLTGPTLAGAEVDRPDRPVRRGGVRLRPDRLRRRRRPPVRLAQHAAALRSGLSGDGRDRPVGAARCADPQRRRSSASRSRSAPRWPSLKQNADAVEVELSDGRRASYDFVVGCDGIRSTVRKLAFERCARGELHRARGLARDHAAAQGRRLHADVLRPEHQGRRQSAFARRDVPVPGPADPRRPAAAAGPDASCCWPSSSAISAAR